MGVGVGREDGGKQPEAFAAMVPSAGRWKGSRTGWRTTQGPGLHPDIVDHNRVGEDSGARS